METPEEYFELAELCRRAKSKAYDRFALYQLDVLEHSYVVLAESAQRSAFNEAGFYPNQKPQPSADLVASLRNQHAIPLCSCDYQLTSLSERQSVRLE